MYFAAYDARLGIDSAERCLSNINSRLKVVLSGRQGVSTFKVSEVYLAPPTKLCSVPLSAGTGTPRASGTCSLPSRPHDYDGIATRVLQYPVEQNALIEPACATQ